MVITRTWLVFAFSSMVFASACAKGSSDQQSGGKKGKTGTVLGIDPLIYKCENLVTVGEIAEVLGGEVSVMQVAFEPPPGTPEPCHYLRKTEDTQEPWSFDMDCRSDALKTADALFEQYKASKMNDAGAVTNETGLVPIGRKAMDHHGQALIAVDDDTDCYMRVMGPSAEGRAALGKLLIDKLVLENAPMRPRPL